MTSCPEARGWGFWWFLKKAVGWDSTLGEASWDPKLGETSWDLKLDEASPVCGLRDAPRVCWVRWNGQHSKNCVSLSSCRKTKLKKSINVSYLNWRKSSVFRDSYAYEHSTYPYICIVVSWLYFTYIYILHKDWIRLFYLCDYGMSFILRV